MIVDRAEHPMYVSNSYLLAEPGGSGAGMIVDGHGEGGKLIERADADGIEVEKIVLTHHHGDHADIAEYRERFGAPVVASDATAELVAVDVDETFADGDEITAGALTLTAMHTPGHCGDHFALVSGDGDVLTGDVLFKGTVGGTMAPGATGFADLRSSVMDRLMKLSPDTRVHPGHTLPTTIGAEWEENPFIRIWRGIDEEGTERCTVWERPATLVLWAPDYDGTNKAWVRFDDDGEDGIVGGSQVVRG